MATPLFMTAIDHALTAVFWMAFLKYQIYCAVNFLKKYFFYFQEDFAEMIRRAGFSAVTYENLLFGVSAIHSGFKLSVWTMILNSFTIVILWLRLYYYARQQKDTLQLSGY